MTPFLDGLSNPESKAPKLRKVLAQKDRVRTQNTLICSEPLKPRTHSQISTSGFTSFRLVCLSGHSI